MTTNLREQVHLFKILIIGESSVGKSSILTRFVHGVFNTQYIATIGVDFQIALVNSGDYKCRLQIWDTAGQERFRSITSTYFRGANGVFIVYDVTDKASFAQVKLRISELEHYCDESIPKILLGNKDDNTNQKNKVVSTSEAREYAEQNDLPFYEVSVKDNKNITEAFNEMTRLVLERRLGQAETAIYSKHIEPEQTTYNNRNKPCCPT